MFDPATKIIVFIFTELRTFIGILLVSGYAGAQSYRHMWSSENDLRNEMVYNAMRRDRFEDICRNLHFESELRPPTNNKDKLWKLRPIIHHLKAKMVANFHPEQNLAFDESIIEYFGHHGLKQFIKGKPIRFGFKVWSLCTTSGYLLNFEIYQGASGRANGQYEERFGKCAAPLVFMCDDFSQEVRLLPFSFYFDNLFTGFPLLAYLKLRGYNATGTIRENRIPKSCPIPNKKLLKKKPRGFIQSIQMKDTDIRLTKWIDNSPVSVASTCFGANPISNAARYSKEAKNESLSPVHVQYPNIISTCAVSIVSTKVLRLIESGIEGKNGGVRFSHGWLTPAL